MVNELWIPYLGVPLIYCYINYSETQWFKTTILLWVMILSIRNPGWAYLGDSSIPRDVDGDHSAIFSWKMASITRLTPYRGRKMAVTLDLAGTISQSTCMRPFQYGSLRVIRLFNLESQGSRVMRQELRGLLWPSLRSDIASLPSYSFGRSSHQPAQIQGEETQTPTPPWEEC